MVNNHRLNAWDQNMSVLGNWGPPWCYRAMALIEFQKHILSTEAECEVASWLVLGTVVQCLHCFSWQPPSLFPA